ncbi:MAG TPA: alcohol dehydrogenase catalytic domain-containing protein [Dehalococcoidia bacterium]|nr:alcohol dehydrogenase catalytic domain-containing protein [Dehalococcoidia bacterium]
MKAVVFKGQGHVAVEERPAPRIEEPTDAIVRVSMAAICGTDVRVLQGRIPGAPDAIIGHEFCGVIEDVGPEVTGLKPGERVVSPFSVFCGGCFYCKKGLLTACERRQVYGFGALGGAQAEFVRVPSATAVLEKLPDAITDTQAAFLSDILPGTFAGLQLAGLAAGDSVAVVGCGPTGVCTQLLARAMGAATVIGIDRHASRLAAAERLGSAAVSMESGDPLSRVRGATGGRGADLAVEATGTLAGLVAASALARPWGTLLSLGVGIERAGEFPAGSLAGRHVKLVPAGIPPVKNYIEPLMKMLANGVIDPSPIATHILPLEEAPRGYDLMAGRRDGALKVLLKP